MNGPLAPVASLLIPHCIKWSDPRAMMRPLYYAILCTREIIDNFLHTCHGWFWIVKTQDVLLPASCGLMTTQAIDCCKGLTLQWWWMIWRGSLACLPRDVGCTRVPSNWIQQQLVLMELVVPQDQRMPQSRWVPKVDVVPVSLWSTCLSLLLPLSYPWQSMGQTSAKASPLSFNAQLFLVLKIELI